MEEMMDQKLRDEGSRFKLIAFHALALDCSEMK